MNNDREKGDPRKRNDDKSFKQTNEPWKGNPEKEQKSQAPKEDLEKWQRSSTH